MKKHFTIWAAFVLFIFIILLTTNALAVSLYIAAARLELSVIPVHSPLQPLMLIAFISVIFGTILSAATSKKMMKFIYELRDATKQVATGNFTIELKEDSRVSEINTLIHDFNKMVKDLGSIETLRDDFITSVSHEIKTPIASIEGCVELLKDQALTEDEFKEYIHLIDISAKRLSVLTANILRLSKLENQEILADQTEFSLDEQIRQAILLLEHQWSTNNLNLNINLTPVCIRTNKELLMQVWINLIDNAIKFSKTGSCLDIELCETSERVLVRVIDYGIGIKEENLKYIFQKFYQDNESRSDQGNGLGLALVKRILELTGGYITVESRFGKGSVFTVDLPKTN